MADERFFIGSDDSGHDYIVPLGRLYAWRDWCAIPDDDERSWDVPEFAQRIDGGTLTFTNPRFD